MNINHYKKNVLEQFLNKRRDHPEESGRKVPVDTIQLPTGGIKVVDAAVMVFDIANSKNSLEKLGEKKYIEWLGMTLHCFFHCVDDYDGTVDKYTGDGAMVSFSLGSKEERCINAKECAVRISQILNKLLNPHFKKKNLKLMNVRIGIDFGPIRIEKIGKKGNSHLIIVGSAANSAKILEQKGKNCEFDQYTTILLGYDVIHILPKKYLTNNKGEILYRNKGYIDGGQSYVDKSEPYKVYEYFGRIRD